MPKHGLTTSTVRLTVACLQRGLSRLLGMALSCRTPARNRHPGTRRAAGKAVGKHCLGQDRHIGDFIARCRTCCECTVGLHGRAAGGCKAYRMSRDCMAVGNGIMSLNQ